MKRLILVATVALSGCASQPDLDADAAAIRSVGQAWANAYVAGDYSAIPDYYTEDAVILPRGRPRIEGREALRGSLGGLAAGRRVNIDLTERELVVVGDYAWFISDFRVSYGNPESGEAIESEQGRSLIIFKRGDDGRWRVHRDIDSPAPAVETDY